MRRFSGRSDLRGPRRSGGHLAHAARVAAVATAFIAALYVVAALAFDLLNAHRLVTQVDTHLNERLVDVSHDLDQHRTPRPLDSDVDFAAAPVVLWVVDRNGDAMALGEAAPALPPGAWRRDGEAATATIGTTAFRVQARRLDSGWLVAGESLAEAHHVQGVVLGAELVAVPLVVAATFFGALVIGLKASAPVEQARRRQLEFSADASHELRTPLSVIEAEVDLALGGRRNQQQLGEALERIGNEGHRLRRIVDDLLWLARFDSEPPPPGDEPIDLGTIADQCAERFAAVAAARRVTLTVQHDTPDPPWICAPPEWIDRLTGVLVDNACRHAGQDGTVRIVVTGRGTRAGLAVQDTGPGIPPAERPQLFDRFHRATAEGTGAGLGLAIADAVVRSTSGRWRIDDAPIGGAHLEVAWHRAVPRHPSQRAAPSLEAPSVSPGATPDPSTSPVPAPQASASPRSADR